MVVDKLKSLLDHDNYYCADRDIPLSQLVEDLRLTDNDNIIIVDYYLNEYQLKEYPAWDKLINDMRLEAGADELTITLKE